MPGLENRRKAIEGEYWGKGEYRGREKEIEICRGS